MKLIANRPIFLTAILFAIGCILSLSFSFSSEIGWLCFVSAMLIFVIFLSVKLRKSLPLLLFIGLLLGWGWSTFYTSTFVDPLTKLQDRTFVVHGVVTQYPTVYEDTQRVEIKFETPEFLSETYRFSTFKTLAYLPLTSTALQPGDKVSGSFRFYRSDVYDGFERAAYYDAKNYYILASATENVESEKSDFTLEPGDTVPVWAIPLKIADTLKTRLSERLDPDTAGFLKALIFGDKSSLSDEDEQAMRKIGLSHIMAVSGLHIGFLVGFFCLCFSKRFGFLISIVAILVFIPMAGYTPSVMRAGIMYCIIAIGFYLKREGDSLSSLGIALCLLLILNPYAIFSLSLQLSFLATLGLILYSGPLQDFLFTTLFEGRKVPIRFGKAVCGSISCSLCAMLFTTPVLLRSFGYLSLLSVLGNLLTFFVVSILFICGLLCAFLPALPVISSVLPVLLRGLCRYVLGIADLLGQFRFLLIYWDETYVKIAIFLIYIIVILALLLSRFIKYRYTISTICGILVVLFGLNIHAEQTQRRITLLPSGGGQAIAVSEGHESLIFIDCSADGSRNAAESMISYMDWNGFSQVDLLILTAVDLTHARNVPELIEKVSIRKIIVPSNTKESDIKSEIFNYAAEYGIPIEEWPDKGESVLLEYPFLSLLQHVDGKLGVRIGTTPEDSMLILHSLTQKMLNTVLQSEALKCRYLVLSARNIEDADLLQYALLKLSPERIYLQSGGVTASRLDGIPAYNTFEEGEICLKFKREGEIS